MADEPAGTLIRLEETGLQLAEPADDIRGRQLIDLNGEEIGKIEGLLIDQTERRVQFLEVGSGGFLGLGKMRQLVPVQAITNVGPDTVQIGKERTHLADAPAYNPDIVPERRYYEDIYGYWDYPSYWTGGYSYPPWRPL